jgi:hypothetical protein
MGEFSKAAQSLTDVSTGGLSSGTVEDFLTGRRGAEAAREAGRIQAAATREGIAELRAGREQAFGALTPFREAGAGQLAGITGLITDPEAQRRFIEDNPFFEALADKAQGRLFASKAAKGKVGTGGTAEELQTSLLGLGNQLLSENIRQRMGLVNVGLGAAGGGAQAAQTASRGIADLIGSGAAAEAAGIVGAENVRTQRENQLLQLTSSGIAASDRRVKKDIKMIGFNKFPVYSFKYIWDDEEQIGYMAQDVEKTLPEAVIEIDGIKHVNYGVIYGH